MIRHNCDGCKRRFGLDGEIDPYFCTECGAILCGLCQEDGCCRAVPPGPPCPDCGGSGCETCHGYGYPEARPMQRKRA